MKILKTIIQQIILIFFDDMIAEKEANKNLSPIVTELFSRGRKVNNSLVLFFFHKAQYKLDRQTAKISFFFKSFFFLLINNVQKLKSKRKQKTIQI